jgi:MFS family permease
MMHLIATDESAENDSPSSSGSWISGMSRQERSAFVATFSGWMLDGMDVMVYSLVLPALLIAWHLTKSQAGLLNTATLLVSSLGGWLAGILADRYGRVRLLKVTVFWFAFFTFLSGFTQNFEQLLVTRSLQGLGFGGEWAVGAALISETVRSRYRGRAVGTVQSGWAIGWGISVLAFTFVFARLPHELAWRVMFWIGILPALLIVYIRRNVEEPKIFHDASHQRTSIFAIFSPHLLRPTLFAALLALGAQGGYHAVTTWLPLYLTESRGITTLNSASYLLIVIGGAFLGYLTAAHLTDSLGRRRTLILFAACSFITVLAYTRLPISNHIMLLLGFPLGFFPSGSFSPMGAWFNELFPTQVRASGAAFAYNLGRGAGALFPALVGFVSERTSLGAAIALFGSGAYLVMILGAVFLPETRGKTLEA